VTASGRAPDAVRAVEFVAGAVRANNPQIAYSNQAYKGYGLVEAGSDLRVQYRAVRDVRQPTSDAFTLRTFRVEAEPRT
jgi:hypothetical protein